MTILSSISTSALLASGLFGQALAATPVVAHGGPLTRFGVHSEIMQRGRPAKTDAKTGLKANANTPATYAIIDAPGAGTASGQGTVIYAVNTSSASSGWYRDSRDDYHGFLREPEGSFQTFDADGPNSQTQPDWMNDKGVVVGFYFDPNTGIEEGFLRTPSGKVKTFDGGGGGSTFTVVNSVNDGSEVIGEYGDANYNDHGFYRLKNGTLTQFDVPGATGTLGFDINDSGTITGPYYDSGNNYHAFLRTAGSSFTEFDAPGAGAGPWQGTFALGINKKGWTTGQIIDSNYTAHGFVRDPSGGITIFDAPDAGAGPQQGTYPIELNSVKTVAGYYIDASGIYHGFVRSKNGHLTEFDAPGSGNGTGQGTEGFGINKFDVISGWLQDGSGVYHGFLRVP